MASFSHPRSGPDTDDGEPQFILPGRGGGSPNGKPSKSTADAAAQITRDNARWNGDSLDGNGGPGAMGQPAVVTYAFAASARNANGTSGFSPFSAQQIAMAEQSLRSWSDVANITFVRVGSGTSGAGAFSNDAAILFQNYAFGAAGFTSFGFQPGQRAAGAASGDIYINATLPYNADPQLFGYGALVLTHEIGFAIGLGLPANYVAGPGGRVTYDDSAQYFEDSLQYTVMSPFDSGRTGADFGRDGGGDPVRFPAAPMLDDIAAAQRLYGANMSTRTGDDVYGFGNTTGRAWYGATAGQAAPIFAVWDAGGSDTFDFSGYAQAQEIDLRATAFSSVGGLRFNVAIAAGVTIENAIGGSGADTLIGNAGNNLLVGNGGYDVAVIGVAVGGAIVSALGGDVVVQSSQGRDTTRGVEELRFSDASIYTAHVAPTLRSYDLLTERAATGGELAYWTTQIQNGGVQGNVVAAIINGSSAAAATAQSLIEQYYQSYLGRSASASDSSFWNSALRSGNTSVQQLRDALASQPGAGGNEAAFIDASYRGWFGRAATTAEIDVWKGLFAQLEASPSDLRAALIADGAGRSYIASVTDRLYETWFGRDPSQGELDAWYGLFRDGAEYGALRSALIAEPAGRSYIASVTDRLYETWFGRDPSQGEIDVWYGEFRNGAEYGALRAILIAEPAGRAHIASVVNSRYGDFFGRAPAAGEVDYWYGQFAGGVEQLTLRQTLVYHPTGVARIQEVVAQGYQEYFGRAPTSAETSYWLDQVQRGTEYAQFRAVLDANNAPAPAIEEPAYGVNADSDDLGIDFGEAGAEGSLGFFEAAAEHAPVEVNVEAFGIWSLPEFWAADAAQETHASAHPSTGGDGWLV